MILLEFIFSLAYYKMKLKFVHITKCSGTFIEDIGKIHNIEWGRFHKEEYKYHHELFTLKPESLKKKYHWFVIVRNPYDRILSEYYCRWGYGIGSKNITHTKEEFNDFLIEKIKKRSLTGEHYTEQYKYIDHDPNININIIKFENLYEELDDLFKRYQIDIDIYKLTKKINSKECANSTIPFTIHDFNKDLIQYINEIYDKDFLLFHYPKITI